MARTAPDDLNVFGIGTYLPAQTITDDDPQLGTSQNINFLGRHLGPEVWNTKFAQRTASKFWYVEETGSVAFTRRCTWRIPARMGDYSPRRLHIVLWAGMSPADTGDVEFRSGANTAAIVVNAVGYNYHTATLELPAPAGAAYQDVEMYCKVTNAGDELYLLSTYAHFSSEAGTAAPDNDGENGIVYLSDDREDIDEPYAVHRQRLRAANLAIISERPGMLVSFADTSATDPWWRQQKTPYSDGEQLFSEDGLPCWIGPNMSQITVWFRACCATRTQDKTVYVRHSETLEEESYTWNAAAASGWQELTLDIDPKATRRPVQIFLRVDQATDTNPIGLLNFHAWEIP